LSRRPRRSFLSGDTAATLTGATVSSNTAQGAAYKGYPVTYLGGGMGGGFYINALATVCLDAFTRDHVTGNTVSTSDPGIYGSWTLCP
jgi:hypothetical protein